MVAMKTIHGCRLPLGACGSIDSAGSQRWAISTARKRIASLTNRAKPLLEVIQREIDCRILDRLGKRFRIGSAETSDGKGLHSEWTKRSTVLRKNAHPSGTKLSRNDSVKKNFNHRWTQINTDEEMLRRRSGPDFRRSLNDALYAMGSRQAGSIS